MKSFKHYITEAKRYPTPVKGWGNADTGKLVLTRIIGLYRPYHEEFAANNLRKFGLREKDAVTAMKQMGDGWNTLQDIKDGNVDRDMSFGPWLNSLGWYPVVVHNGSNSIGEGTIKGVTLRKMHKIAVALDDKYGDSLWVEHGDGIEIGNHTFDNKYDWDGYIKTKRLTRRTEIGRTMSQFREQSKEKNE